MDRFRKIKPIGVSDNDQIIPLDVEKKLTSHVPDLVVFDKNLGKVPHILKFDGVLLFADVSGFTALTEKYTMSSEKGTDALTVTLNNYIGKIVQKILQAGGDILKFAGDAILAVWKVTERSFLNHAISQASKCSLEIQDKCDNQETDVGVKLRVKIAISAGKIFATFVGNEESRHFVMAGRPVREVKAAEKYCQAGLVVLSPNAMELSDRTNIITKALSERFGLVKYLRHEPRLQWQEYVDIPKHMKFTISAETSIRLALGIRGDINRETVIRKYVSPVVQRKLDDDQQLRYLSEMRQCSIAFINLSFDLNERDRLFHEKQCENMQTSFSIVYANISARQGSLNKIFMFDKGCTFLVIFGLPGDKHEQEPAHALQAAWKISKELNENLASLTLSSIGVTTGPVFCGVIGHEERHEYTVIGQKVNLAARLMMHYPNVVSCDCETFKSSKLSKDAFTRLPQKAMKGVGDVIVYDYTEGERKPVATTIITEPDYPIIGRREEVAMFMDELLKTKNTPSLGEERRVIVFEGEAGYGKTRVMKEIQWQAACTEGIRVISFTLSINDVNEPFFAVKTLLELLLDIDSSQDVAVKEKALKAAVNQEDSEYLCLFNDLITWFNFPKSKKVENMHPEERTNVLHNLMVKLVKKTTAYQFVLFALDDAQNVDSESWEFITTLSKDAKALCVVAMRPFSPDKPPCEPAKQVLFHPKTVYFKLHGLNNDQLTPLACQLLQVERIPSELESFLIQRCHNVPLWCEQLLVEMLNAGVLLIVPLSSNKRVQPGGNSNKGEFHEQTHFKPSVGVADKTLIIKRKNTIIPGKNNLIEEKQPIEIVLEEIKNQNEEDKAPKRSSLASWSNKVRYIENTSPDMNEFLKHGPETRHQTSITDLEKDESYKPMRCVIKPGFILSKFPMPASIRGMALTRLDRMMPFEQLVVKCAAVIGENVSRKMLKAVIPGCNEEKFRRAIFELMKTRVFECASEILVAEKPVVKEKQSVQLDRMSHCITCACHRGSTEVLDDKTITERCEQLKFQKTLVQETAYNLWLADQRRSLHEECANFLETKIDQILITGATDEEIRMQFHLARIFNKITETNSKRAVVIQSTVSMRDSVASNRDIGIMTSAPNIAVQTSIETLKSNATASSKVNLLEPSNLGTPDFNQRRISHGSVIGRMTSSGVGARKSVCMPLIIEEHNLADDYMECNHSTDIADTGSSNNSETNRKPSVSPESKEDYLKAIMEKVDKRKLSGVKAIPESEYRKLSFAPLWAQSIGITSSFDRILNNTEEQAKQLAHLKLNSILRTPFEIHETCALLYNQLVWHWRRSLNTEKTITFLLKAAESSIAINGYGPALSFLQEAFKIVSNLGKGLDIVSNFTEDDDLNLDDIKVLSVSKQTKAKIQSLLGEVLFKQGELEESLQHFYKALNILGSNVPTNLLCISLRSWYESKVQASHVNNPSKYIGKASSKVANKYVEQVRCLSYVWQILLNVKNIPNRMKMSKMVANMQVNRAESADDDLKELITSYTYMMQMHQLSGQVGQSTYYESRATARCLELPAKLTVPDLFITGHLHLVSCSVRLCQGKLAYAMTAGYRAYNVADELGDVDIKLLVLPIIFQIHLLTEKGQACVKVLQLLLDVAKENTDEMGKSSYYTSCFDLILDANYSLESAETCVNHIQSMESMLDIGDVLRFYFRTSMAVWCYRRNMINEGKAWLKLSTQIKPECLDGFLLVRAFARLVEAYLLKFRSLLVQNGSKDKETKKEEDFCRGMFNKFLFLCKSFPVFTPRLNHLNAFFHLLTGYKSKAKDLILKAVNGARFCGNKIDNVWALHSQNVWFSGQNFSPKQLNKWVDNCQTSVTWQTANEKEENDWCFSFLPISNF